jgi:hypothetical protein
MRARKALPPSSKDSGGAVFVVEKSEIAELNASTNERSTFRQTEAKYMPMESLIPIEVLLSFRPSASRFA